MDLVDRNFTPLAPDRLWVADFTYVSTWSGWCYVAFVIDAYARRILGWRCATTMTSQLVLDALEQAIWTRQREGTDLDRSDRASRPRSRSTLVRGLLRAARRRPGSTPRPAPSARRYDNALAETVDRALQDRADQAAAARGGASTTVEIATAEWVDWFNHRRLYEYCGDLPPAEAEQRSLRSPPDPSNRWSLKLVSLRTRRGGSGRHARGVFRKEAHTIEVAKNLTQQTKHPDCLLWVGWLVTMADKKTSEDEASLLRHLVHFLEERHQVVDDDLARTDHARPRPGLAAIGGRRRRQE